jgi:hypothetical protein
MKEYRWLRLQILDVQNEVQGWPEWMKKDAHFDGIPRQGSEFRTTGVQDSRRLAEDRLDQSGSAKKRA